MDGQRDTRDISASNMLTQFLFLKLELVQIECNQTFTHNFGMTQFPIKDCLLSENPHVRYHDHIQHGPRYILISNIFSYETKKQKKEKELYNL